MKIELEDEAQALVWPSRRAMQRPRALRNLRGRAPRELRMA
jgi:hypothetical protein